MKPVRSLPVLLLIMLVAAVVRAIQIGAHPFWYDEALSLLYTSDLARLLPGGERGTDSQLFLFSLYLWRMLGESEGLLRTLPLLFGLATVPVLYKLGDALAGRTVGLIAAAMLATNALHAYYAQELRTYTLTALLTTAALLAFVRLLQTRRTAYLIGFFLLGWLATLTHYYAALLFVAANLYVVALFGRHRDLIRRWVIAHLFLGLLAIPIGIAFVEQLRWAVKIHWAHEPSFKEIVLMFNHFSFGYYITHSLWRKLCMAVALGLLGWGVVRLHKNKEGTVARGGLITLFALVPIAVVLLASLLIKPAFLTRYFLFCSPPIFLAQAAALAAIRPRWVAGGVAAFLLAGNLYSLAGHYTNVPLYEVQGVTQKSDTRQMAQYILDRREAGDAIVHTLGSTAVPVRFYCRGEKIENILLVFPGRDASGLAFGGLENEHPVYPLDDPSRLENTRRLWYVKGWWVNEQDPYCLATSSEAIKWLGENFDIRSDGIPFNGGTITLYVNKKQSN